MPRAKRTLKEADPNAELAPSVKRTSTGKPADKENAPSRANAPAAQVTYSNYTIVELKQILRTRELAVSGNKTALISRLEEADRLDRLFSLLSGQSMAARGAREGPEQASNNKAAEGEGTTSGGTDSVPTLEWLLDTCPGWAKETDSDEDEDDDEDDDENDEEDDDSNEDKDDNENSTKKGDDDTPKGGTSIMVNFKYKTAKGTPADTRPDWLWVTSAKGAYLRNHLVNEMMKRDQDNFAMHNFEDWNGHGTIEVMENALIEFDKDFKRKDVTSEALWPHIEGLAWFFHTGMDEMHWAMLGDPQDRNNLVVLLGAAILSTLDMLKKDGKLDPNTSNPIRNLGLILALWIKFAEEGCDDNLCNEGEANWAIAVVKMATEHGIEIKGPHSIETKVQELRREKGKPKAKAWKSAFATYKRNHETMMGMGTGVGGRKYDLTALSKAERAERSWGGGVDFGSDVDSDEPGDDLIMCPY